MQNSSRGIKKVPSSSEGVGDYAIKKTHQLQMAKYKLKDKKNQTELKSTLFSQGVEDYAIKMTQVPSSDIRKTALATEDQEMFTQSMIGQLKEQFLNMMAQLANAKRVLDTDLMWVCLLGCRLWRSLKGCHPTVK